MKYKRTHNCGELTTKDAEKQATINGWVDSIRISGKIGFINLRDRSGIVQCFCDKRFVDILKEITRESVLQIKGTVSKRPTNLINKDMTTGEIEIQTKELEILAKADPLPLEIDEDIESNEDTRLKYRYIDLRKPKMQKNIRLRHEIIKVMRDFMDKEDFYEITTPLLTKSTPEGARDYIVPSRVHKGKFYALPQSPQQYKQLLMVAGFEKYFQIAPCLRDEGARSHRCPGEFYQLDVEMSFVKRDDVLDLIERVMIEIVKKVLPDKKITFKKFPRLTYDEVMKKYKTDSPDLRKDKNNKDEFAFCWVIDFPLFKKQTEEDFFHGAGKKWAPSHHMFTMPQEKDIKHLNEKDAGKIKSYQYDLVVNGYEVGGGSIRIHDPKIQEKVFELIGFTEKQKKEFEHILTAFKYGAPPHGGIALGIDRLLMVLFGEENIREVVAFPKNKDAKDLMMNAPSEITKEQLDELGIKLK